MTCTSIIPFPYSQGFTQQEDVKIVNTIVDSIPFCNEIKQFVEKGDVAFMKDLTVDQLNELCKSMVYLGLDVHVQLLEEVFWWSARSNPEVFIIKGEWNKQIQDHYFLWMTLQKNNHSLLQLAINQQTCECHIAAQRGNIRLLKYLRENGCHWNEYTCSHAARNGHLEVLKWARQNGCPWSEYTCFQAAENGHLEVLKWARENGCPWNEYTCFGAAENGHLEVLKWARKNGCPEYDN